MTRDEAERFLTAVDEVCPEWWPFFLTALRAGLRKGELIALKWGDFNSVRVQRIRIDTYSFSEIGRTAASPPPRVRNRVALTCPSSYEGC